MELSKEVLDIRKNWAISDAKRDAGLTTPEDIERFDNISYGPFGTENLLDVYVPSGTEGLLPTIVNIHGGGWVYGSKEIYQFYCMSLAEHGFTVVNINYRLAPETRFPGAVEDINRVLSFIEKEGSKYHADKERLILVGDSAGGQLVSHYSTIFTNPEFAKLFDLSLPDVKIKAVGLNCGTYDGRKMVEVGLDSVFFEYLGCKSKEASEDLLNKVDTMRYITKDFPPAYVMSCANDFLLPLAKPMYEHLEGLGIPCRLKIYGTKERTEVAHVFHVNIRLPEATECNDDECEFFRNFA